jgi:hypothetical protein
MFSSQLPPNTHLASRRRYRDEHVEMDFRLSFVVVGGFTFVIEKFVSLRRGEMSAIQLFAPAADASAASGPLLMPLNATATLRSLCCCYRLFYSLLGPPRSVCVCMCARECFCSCCCFDLRERARTKHGSFLNMCRSRRRRRSHQGQLLPGAPPPSYAFCAAHLPGFLRSHPA